MMKIAKRKYFFYVILIVIILLIKGAVYADISAGDLKKEYANENPILTEVLTGVSGPRGVVFKGDALYIAEASAGRISKFNAATLGVNQFDKNNDVIIVFPNPANSFLQVSGLITTGAYKIYDVSGRQVQKGTISEAKEISIKNLARGIFFLNLKNRDVLKFIKN